MFSFSFSISLGFGCCCILYSTSLSSYVQPDDGHHYGQNMYLLATFHHIAT